MTQLWPNRAIRYRLTAGLLLLLSWHTQSETFENAIATASWQVEASVFECRLHHAIPRFGTAVFAHRAGEAPRFYLQQKGPYRASGQAELTSRNPAWRESPRPRVLAQVELSGSDELLQLGQSESRPLMAELRQGKRLMFSHAPGRGQERPVRIMIEPIGFRPALKGYQECLAGLLPVNYDQVARTALYYASSKHELPGPERDKLDRVALYVLADPRVTSLYIDGHTDGVGLRAANLELSQARAETVRDYLVSLGVGPDRITTRWHGERYPVASNREAEGRGENRRVTIRLERAEGQLSAR